MTSRYKMILLLFTSFWMSFASEKLEGSWGKRAKTDQGRSKQQGKLGRSPERSGVNMLRPYWKFPVRIGICNQLAVKLASSEVVSPSELVTVIRYLPAFKAGAAIFSVFMSTNVTATVLPPMVALAPVSKPLPRIVKVAPPDESPLARATLPMPIGTRPSCTTVKPDA